MKIDQLALKHFDSAEDFGNAMQLLFNSIAALQGNPSFEEYEENFLADLDDLDEWLLSKAENFNQQIFAEFKKLQEEVAFLREALRKGPGSAQDHDSLLDKLEAKLHPPLSDEENPILEALFEQWQDNNKGNLVESSFANAYVPAIELFIRFVNDYEGDSVRVNSLKPEHIRYYQQRYIKIPKGVKALDFSIPQLVRKKGDTKSPKTVSDNFSNIGTFLNWILTKGFPIDGNLAKILTKGSDVRTSEKTTKKRTPYTGAELKTLFNSDSYLRSGAFKTSGMYWVPLIALFTGARMSEILQLEVHDVEKVEGVWVFHFDDLDHRSTDQHKRLKQAGSRRIVPIHKQLLNLKFIDYVKTREDRLFPDEPRNAKGKFDAFQKRHTYYRKQLGVKPKHKMELKDFHSFRHTVRTRLAELRTTGHVSQQFDEGLIDAIVGHTSKGRSIGESTYNHHQYIKTKNKAINRLTYPSINFDKLLTWGKCEFARVPFRKSVTERRK